MNLKKYLVFRTVYNPNHSKADPRECLLKLRVIEGFNINKAYEVFDIKDDYVKPNDGGKTYIMPGSKIPRYKIKDVVDTTIKLEKASAVVINKYEIDSQYEGFDILKSMYTFNEIDIFSQWVELLIQQDVKTLYNSIIANNNIDSIILDCDTYKEVNHFYNSYTTNGDRLSDYIRSSTVPINIAIVPINATIRNIQNFYSDKSVIDLANKDKTIIDYKVYHELKALVESEDVENHKLLIELISNCNIKESIVNILLLIAGYDYKLKPLKEIEHINFKSVLNYLEISKFHKNFTYNYFINILSAIGVKELTYSQFYETLKLYKTTDILYQNFKFVLDTDKNLEN